MGIAITDEEGVVALYDTVTRLAFGPVFCSIGEANAFLEWMADREKYEDVFAVGHENIYFRADVRIYRTEELLTAVNLWREL